MDRLSIEELWQRSKPGMLERVETLEQFVAAIVAGGATDNEAVESQRIAHRIAGTAGMFGFGEASRIARSIEKSLERNDDDVHQLADLTVALVDSFGVADTGSELEPIAPPEGVASDSRLVVVDVDEPVLRRRLLDDFVARGVNAVASDRLPAAASAVAFVVHLRDSDSRARMVRYLPPRSTAPVVAVIDPANPSDRVAAADAGADLIVSTSDSAASVVEHLVSRLESGRASSALSVMLVDDDPLVHDHVAVVTQQHGWQLNHVLDPRETWQALDTHAPDVLMVDLDMPDIDGLTLTRALRASLTYRHIPVFVLTASNDADTVDRAFAAGVDDLLAKPLDPTVASARIRRHLQRLPNVAGSSTGSLTALPGKVVLTDRLHDLDQSAPGGPADVTVGVIRLVGVDLVADARGGDVAAEFVRRIARQITTLLGEATLCHLGGYDIGGLFEGGKQQAERQLQRVFGALRTTIDLPAEIRLHAGVAHSSDGIGVEHLLDAAQDALVLIDATSSDRIERNDVSVDRADVVLVEDDVLLAEVVVQALQADGLSTTVIGNGADAVAWLGGGVPQMRARVILLDVDLPGMNGLDVLRQLNLDGVTADTPVVLMAARTRESELVAALRFGAVDHIAKPMSLPVLVERTRRLMRSQR